MTDTLDITIDDSGNIDPKQVDDLISRALQNIRIHSNLWSICMHATLFHTASDVKNYIDKTLMDSDVAAYAIVHDNTDWHVIELRRR